MQTLLGVLCILFSIRFIDNTQCQRNAQIVGPCGCCPIIGGVCISYEGIDGLAALWHVCVPAHLKETFTLDQCMPKILPSNNFTRLCRTANETFRIFPQCATKQTCLLPKPSRPYKFECHTPMAVKGSCKRSIKRFTYDANHRQCVPFTYSGCGGSTNRFFRQKQCEKLCLKPT
ncbi:unnamed protein product [Adineta ricciae]|uniref:BPTI/Kunitz inhibitor domain-containing protein n=1 Tax=Adineta ricciae TaxID=249248 RepID=A0A815PS96_ADIRI|nr:unnamed protein product [Adineta ricciae]CAF1453222.1 unnamed protein product [Adineta ricciae]